MYKIVKKQKIKKIAKKKIKTKHSQTTHKTEPGRRATHN